MLASEPRDGSGELDQALVCTIPVHPGGLGILRVAVVIAALRAAQFVAVQDHRHALAEEQGGEEVALLPVAEGLDRGIVARPFDPAVPRAVVVGAVFPVLAVGVVVFVVVRDEVAQGEAVVRGDEVDRGDRSPTGVLVEVGGAGQPGGQLTERRRLAAPEVAHGVAVLAVPLRPLRREVANLVAARSDVPRLGDEFDLRDDRVLLHEFEEGGELVDLVELAGQGGRQVEAETVDVHLGHPVPQAVHDQLQGVRVAGVERVAGARVVHIELGGVIHQPVIGGVVDATHRERRAELVALGGVVVDDIQDHLDAGRVQRLHHPLELLHLLPEGSGGRVRGVRREERDRVVAPIVAEALLLQGVVVDELVHGHQLDRGHADLLQVSDDGGMGDAAVGSALLLGDIGMQLCQALHVRFVDDRLGERGARRVVAGPVEERVHDDAVHRVLSGVVGVDLVGAPEVVGEQRLPPADVVAGRFGVRVEQQLGRIAALALAGIPRSGDPESVALPWLHAGQIAMPHVPVDFGELDSCLGEVLVEQTQFNAVSHLAEEGEVGAVAVEGGTERVGGSWPELHSPTVSGAVPPPGGDVEKRRPCQVSPS